MRILHVLPYAAQGGMELNTVWLAEQLIEAGHEVAIASPAGRGLAGFSGTVIRMPHAPTDGVHAVPYAMRLATAIRRWRPDLVHGHGVRMAPLLSIATLAGRTRPALVTVHGMAPEQYDAARRVLRWSGIAVNTVGPGVTAELERRGVQCTTIENGVTPPPLPVDRAMLFEELDLDTALHLVVAVGRLVDMKNHGMAIRAITRVPRAALVIAGEGPRLDELRALAHDLGVHDRVRLIGHRDDAREILGAADLSVLTTRWEGLSRAALEALVAGVPLISTDAVGIREWVRPEFSVVVAQDDDAALAAAIRDLLDDPATRSRMSAAARRFGEGSSVERMRDRYLALYHDLAGRAPHPTSDAPPRPGIDVVVPSHQRPESLTRCLGALARQTVAPARIIVVARADDHATQAAARSHAESGVHVVTVDEPGVIAALSAGVAASTAGIVAFTDDDAMPYPDWIERFTETFADPSVGAVGGRDVIPGEEGPLTDDVGHFQRFGRLVGNHHLGRGPARDVDVLKGVDMAVRADALALPAPGVLRGSGAQVDYEVLICAWVQRCGGRVVYDPAIRVDHHPATRLGPDRRNRPRASAVFDAAYNSVVASTVLAPRTMLTRAGFGLAVGSRGTPGVVRAAAALVRREPEVLRRLLPSLGGKLLALFDMVAHRWGRRTMVAAGVLRDTRRGGHDTRS